MLESAKVGNIADSLIGQANGIEVGDVFGFLILLYILANGNTDMIQIMWKETHSKKLIQYMDMKSLLKSYQWVHSYAQTAQTNVYKLVTVSVLVI